MDFYLLLPFVVAIIENEKGEILLGRHRDDPENKAYPRCWDLPGGKMRRGESYRECCEREIEEETGFKVFFARECGSFHHSRDEFRPDFTNFVPGGAICFEVSVYGDFKPSEMEDMHWVGIEEMHTLEVTPWTEHFLRYYLYSKP
jgi:8-oxo-dGTP pyrophosphatase MutT (NUDIX family)